ncbi:MAG: O-antigen ligase family protein [Clostridia bacterium]|nr:O-antigen ligase family protein [Clostridia bacterium]
MFSLSALMPEYFAPVLAVVCFIKALNARVKSGAKYTPGSVATSVAIFMAWMLIGAIYSRYRLSAFVSIGLWLLMFTGFYLTSELTDTKKKMRDIFFCGCITSGTAGLIGIIQIIFFHLNGPFADIIKRFFNPFWHFLDVLISKLVVLLPGFIVSSMSRTKFLVFPTRACSTFSNPLFFAAFEVMMLPFTAYCFLYGSSKKRRIAGFICFLLTLGGVASSYSRGPYIYAAAVVVILLLFGGKKARYIGGMSIAGLGVIAFFARGTIKRILSIDMSEVSVNTRYRIWQAVFVMAKRHPIFGMGTGFNNVRQALHGEFGIMQPHAHNIIFEILLENGVIGVVIFALIFVGLLVNFYRLYRMRGEPRTFAITLFASIAGFFLCGMTDCLFYGLKPLQYMMLVLGLSQAAFKLYLGDNELDIWKSVWISIKKLAARAKKPDAGSE